jgi:hypothetical protein
MYYLSDAFCSMLFPKLLGAYELELKPYILQIIELEPSHILVVGAADGYYAIGLARSLLRSKILAYEENRQARSLLSTLAVSNRVQDRIEIRGRCNAQNLQAELHLNPKAALIMDIEGAEETVLDPNVGPALKELSFGIIEVHSPAIGNKIISRFSKTHHIEVVVQRPRRRSDIPSSDIPFLDVFAQLFYRYFLNEHRGSTFWIILQKQQSYQASEIATQR